MDKCPSDFISLVKIYVLIQSLELILERGGLVERENPVVKYTILTLRTPQSSVATEPDRTGLKYAGTGPDKGPSPVSPHFRAT